jgi:hypothetical protein
MPRAAQGHAAPAGPRVDNTIADSHWQTGDGGITGIRAAGAAAGRCRRGATRLQMTSAVRCETAGGIWEVPSADPAPRTAKEAKKH